MKSIFQYSNYLEYLNDFYSSQKKSNKNYSYQEFADQSGLKSKGNVNLIFSGTRNPTLKSIPLLIKGLHLNKIEGEYFKTMVFYNLATDPLEKKEYFETLISFGERIHFYPLEKEHYCVLSSVNHLVIYTMFDLYDFPKTQEETYEWVKNTIDQNLSLLEIKIIFKDLLQAKLIDLINGEFTHSRECLSLKSPDGDYILARYLDGMLKLAMTKILDPTESIQNFACTIPIQISRFNEIRAFINDFRTKLLSKYQEKGKDALDEIYQLNFQFFQRTRFD